MRSKAGERSGEAVRFSALSAIIIRNDGNGFDLQEKVRVCQPGHHQHGDKRRVGPFSPFALKHFESILQWLSFHHMDIPLDDVFQSGPCCRQRDFQVPEHLLGLPAKVTFSDFYFLDGGCSMFM